MNNQKWIDYALTQGFEAFEIYQLLGQTKAVSWFEGQRDSFVTSRVLGTSLRGTVNGKLANYSVEDPSDSNMEKVVADMKAQAEAITSDEEAIIRKPEDTDKVESIKNWVKPSNDEIIKMLARVEEKAKNYDPRIVQVAGISWEETKIKRVIVNSNGMNVEDEGYAQLIFAQIAAAENGDVQANYKVQIVEDLSKFDVDKYIDELCGETVKKLGATSLKSGQYPVIMEKGAMTTLMACFTGMFSGDLISKGISPLKESFGKQIFSEKITVIDDPRQQKAISLANYDDEGCPTKEKKVVDKGVFTTILFDSKSAKKMGAESTGNGFRASYNSPVNVAPKNLYIVPGDKDLDALCKDMGDGLVITGLMGMHAGIDFVTSYFSLQCSGYWVKDGKRDHSVSLITMAANFLEFMKSVEEVGSDIEWSYENIACPSIRFTSCAISGE